MNGDEATLLPLCDLYAAGATVVHPCEPALPPLRSRDAIRDHFVHRKASLPGEGTWSVRELTVRNSADGEYATAEFAYEIRRTASVTRLLCVFVSRVRNAEIVDSRDYLFVLP